MEKTIKQIADELGIDKQKVYRFIKKNCINEVNKNESVKRYDEVAQKQIKQGLKQNEVHKESASKHINDTVIETLLKQLDTKDQQIAELQKLLDQAQQLNMADKKRIEELEEKQKSQAIEENQAAVVEPGEQKKTWWKFWK